MQTFGMLNSTAPILTWGTDPDDGLEVCENPTCTSTLNVHVPPSIYDLSLCEACRILFGSMTEVLDIANTYDAYVLDELEDDPESTVEEEAEADDRSAVAA